MNKQELAEELLQKVKYAEIRAKELKLDVKELGDKVFIQHEGEKLLNPKYIKLKEYFELVEFEDFVKSHEELTGRDYKDLLRAKFVEFAFLRKIYNTFDGVVEDLKRHGAHSVAIIYVSKKMYVEQQGFSI